ncbi:HHIP-like protein 1 [Elysia marginata]|uniref:HHIP-like protein 1 n=1 Tax=Elysia marginata TaxID=1093978 RepID=A0AAV4JNT3_9GAST|nr:HHIP-like protein 1 [Elysia marginata]
MVTYTLTIITLAALITIETGNGQNIESAMPTVVPGSIDSCYCLQDALEEEIFNAASVVIHRKPKEEEDSVLIAEQRGVISEYSLRGNAKKKTLLDIKDRVVVTSNYGESRGLLSVAPDPHFNTNGRLFVYYIRQDGGEDFAYVSMFQATNDVFDPQSERVLLRVHQPFVHGNGGPMLFGDDGYLYIVTGDGGEDDDPNGYAQNKKTFYGKVLRIDVSGSQDFSEGPSAVAKMYSVPKDNPFINQPATALPEVWALGFRNMWGCSQDNMPGGSGRIFCAETGTDQYDEINIIERGKNYGWNIKEGNVCHGQSSCGPIENEGVPIHNFKHNRSHALVGGFVYRGEDFPWMSGEGFYVYGDVISGQTYLLREGVNKIWKDNKWPLCSNLDLCPAGARAKPLQHLLAFGQDTAGELYLLMTKDLIATTRTAKLLKVVHKNSSSELSPAKFTVPLISFILVLFRSF